MKKEHQQRRDADEIIHLMWRNYPSWPSTFGPCSNDCGLMGRGSGPCASCLEEELRNLLETSSFDLAKELHDYIKLYKETYNCILDHINGELYTHTKRNNN